LDLSSAEWDSGGGNEVPTVREGGEVRNTKKYFFNVIEEAVQNQKYQWGRGGRIEVYENGKRYAIYEARFFIPSEFFDVFREVFDFKSSNYMPTIMWDCEKHGEEKCQ
jgi:hypothetical protein